MSTRLLSFLNTIEQALMADDPEPQGGAWANTRTINFHLGLARLALGTTHERESAKTLGGIVLQSFALADGSICLRATLSWAGHDSDTDVTRSVFDKAGVNWQGEARQIAAAWLSGAPVVKTENAELLAAS
jgi:hypothetical protein